MTICKFPSQNFKTQKSLYLKSYSTDLDKIFHKFSVERLRRYCEFSISIIVAVRHLEFVKYANFDIPHGLRLKSVHLYKISSRSVERLQSYYKLNIFNMAAVRHVGFFVRIRETTSEVALLFFINVQNLV